MAARRIRAMNYHCHKVRVGDAGHKGRGVFAQQIIKAREAVEVAPVMTIPKAEIQQVASTLLGNYCFGSDRLDLLGLGYSSLYNHSSTPNASFVLTERAILVIALRRIEEDEEITFDYGWSESALKAAGILD